MFDEIEYIDEILSRKCNFFNIRSYLENKLIDYCFLNLQN
jgi:hypothetical protein